MVIKTLVIEIMGRHSNIVLIDKNSRVIVDSIKRVYHDMSKVREILPGLKYDLPPSQNKINITNISKDVFFESLKLLKGKKIEKAILTLFEGFSPVLSREMTFRSQVNDKYVEELTNNEIENLYFNLSEFKLTITSNNFKPCTAYIDNNPIEFSCIDLKQYINLKFHKNVNEAALTFYKEKANVENIKTRSHDLKKLIEVHLERLYTKLDKQMDELNNAEKI
ncbi:NFACT family protein [Thermoanaerobacterium sp. RBIITD]|uniref:NFACT family protein n=1 Tax=Thermoanaerobacterium sp. RBIITD TaxID=1550240 RepID=UPI0021018223|nr:NFACT family protein [Thermoanaerobacterium sp. RBIITD]